MDGKPEYPIKVKFINEGEESEYKDEMELACNLEFFDSEYDQIRDPVLVTDRLGREVILKVDKLDLIKFELKAQD